MNTSCRDKVLDAGLPYYLQISSGSMRPLLRPGTMVEIERCNPGELAVGDIIAIAQPEGPPMVHRLVELCMETRTLHTRGDRCTAPDPAASLDDLLGRVKRIEWGPWTLSPAARFDSLLLGTLQRLGPVLAGARQVLGRFRHEQ